MAKADERLLREWQEAQEAHATYCTLAWPILRGECEAGPEGSRDEVLDKMDKLAKAEAAARLAYLTAAGGYSSF